MRFQHRWIVAFMFIAASGCNPGRPTGHKADGGANSGGSGGDNGNGGSNPGGGSGGNSGAPDLGNWPDGCPSATPTALTGKIFAPNGKLPLYNASIYIPSGTPPAFKDGVNCDRCGDIGSRSKAVTQTDASGSFVLPGVPYGDNVPVVIELGKWRRQFTIPHIDKCQSVAVAPDMTRFPKNKSEGSMPQLAIASGAADPFECLLLKIGIDPAEFTVPTGSGKVHFYVGATMPGTQMSGAPKETDSLYTMAQISKYDIVLLPCQGAPEYTHATDAPRKLLTQYLDLGGRVFTTHFSYNWLTYTGSPYNAIGNWTPNSGMDTMAVGMLETSFPKGMNFAQWLHNVDPKVTTTIPIVDPRYDLGSVIPDKAQRWISTNNMTMHATFNTPLDPMKDKDGKPQYCGRVVFSDFHVSADALKMDPMKNPGQTFPDACKMEDMTTQEKALAFMLFDLSACVIPDADVPIP